jgi:Domain of unknown function (DUF4186)
MKNRGKNSGQLRFPQVASEDYVDSVFDMSPEDVERVKAIRPKKLGIVCGRSECEQQLHSYGRPPSRAHLPPGPCEDCGVAVVPWNLMHARDLTQVNLKMDFLKTEWVRHFFFNVPVTPRIGHFAGTEGLAGLESVANDQLSQPRMLNFDPRWDRYQTKMLDGNIVHWARHAMGCCCRRCLAYWHNVPLETTLSTSDGDYFRSLLMSYIKLRIPLLGDARLLVPAGGAVERLSGSV